MATSLENGKKSSNIQADKMSFIMVSKVVSMLFLGVSHRHTLFL
jgi:hypothetical protein